ncbi:fimbrial protein [Caballeronia glathei]|nr:fimbrial protein [Caballeronia glathei]
MPSRFCRRLLESLAILLVAVLSKDALARYSDCTAPLPLTAELSSVSVPSNLAIGQPIPGAQASFSVPINCTKEVNAGDRWYMTVTSAAAITLVAGFTDVYTTTGMSAGVGFRMRGADGSVMAPINYGGTFSTFDIGPANVGQNNIAGRFELIKTSNTIAPGNASFSTHIHVPGYQFANGGTAAASTIKFGYVMQPTTVAGCTVTQTDLAVTMPSVGARSLPTVGDTAAGSSFTIDLNCESGAKPHISLTDATTPSNQSTDLTLAPASTAAGVGVQVLYGATPVTFAPAPYTSMPNGTLSSNGIDLGTRSGVTRVSFSARYKRTGASMTPGTVRALATFTMLYQ